MRWLGKFAFGDEELVLPLPPALWGEAVAGVGGSMFAASGAMAGYKVREDFLLTVPIRFTAAEWDAFQDMIAWGQKGGTITWTPDLDVPGTTYDVNLVSPSAEERWEPMADPTYLRMRVGTIVIRKVDGSKWNLDYFEAADE